MKRWLIASIVVMPALALADPPSPSEDLQAVSQMVIDAAQREAQIRAALIRAQARIAVLDEQVKRREAEAKPPANGTLDQTPKDVTPK